MNSTLNESCEIAAARRSVTIEDGVSTGVWSSGIAMHRDEARITGMGTDQQVLDLNAATEREKAVGGASEFDGHVMAVQTRSHMAHKIQRDSRFAHWTATGTWIGTAMTSIENDER
jgi:hypothetical protein